MTWLIILGVPLAAGAIWVLRGVYYLRKAKRLNAEADRLNAEAAASRARRAEIEAEQARAVVAQGFVAADDLDTEHRAPVPAEETAAVAAVTAGDWAAGAAWIEAAGQDWDERDHRIRTLAEPAAEDDAWLLAWRAARPQDATAAAVHADASVLVAWNVRGSKSAKYTTDEQFRVFHQLLGSAQEAVHEAQRLAGPADPVPYMLEQPIAMALGYSHERYAQLWEQIVTRGPKVVAAHTNALQYWCRKWRGSHEEAESFAAKSAASGAPGDLLTLLPLTAYFERETYESDLDPDVYYKEPHIVAAADAALADLAAADPADPRAVRLRHMLAWILYWQDRYEEALEHFRAVDGCIGAVPWSYSGNPRSRYTKARDYTVRQVTQA
ncbi:hypothetical protein [Streptomyces bambusae]|uniref:DUF4034 domain-containing protein n=1 Tax=Streptomyces bambusae TaxID=1550616 RepID=A0ABS6Z5H7_9ACTN|nr:hypothetical protein [Streptomyces bambusae]MBW5481970.1 hypothetical protein [Streptomyces bambusae]